VSSSKSILKSTSLIGGSSVVSIFFNIVKAKFIAVLLGPSGTGLIGALQSSIQLVQQFSAFGLNNSAVRDIARSAASDNHADISKSIQTLRRAVLITGLLGMTLTILFANPLSEFTFGSGEYTWEIRLLSIAVFFNIIKGGQGALLQGLRRIKTLAKMTIWSSFLGAAISIPVLYFFEMDGVTLFLILLSFGQLLVSWLYAMHVDIKKITLTLREFLKSSKEMLFLGFSFMGGGFVSLAGVYLIRVLLIRNFDLEAAGIYQAAMTVSTVYIGIILQAMGKDFYPRLTEVAENAVEEIRIINEQTEIGMYLAAPGLLFTLALAPVGIRLLYSAEFLEATIILQWMILGIFIRTIVWPIGYLFIARGKTTIFFFNQVFATGIHLAAIYFLIDLTGLEGAGIAFFFMYIVHLFYMYLIAKKENLFKWKKEVKLTILKFGVIFSSAFLFLYFSSQVIGGVFVSILGVGVSFMALHKIMKIYKISSYSEGVQIVKKRWFNR
jgi:PST family polysaccharide transporter